MDINPKEGGDTNNIIVTGCFLDKNGEWGSGKLGLLHVNEFNSIRKGQNLDWHSAIRREMVGYI